MEISPSAPVLVGIDGSPVACRAVAYAAAEASRRGRDLSIVYADAWPVHPNAPIAGTASWNVAQGRATGTEILAEARTAALRGSVVPEDDGPAGPVILTTVVEGLPSPVLVEHSARAVRTVVGRRGHGWRIAPAIGSTAAQVAAYANGPVVVVPELATPDIDAAGVVLGVDDGEHAQAAIEFAFDEASRRRLPLSAVRAWTLFSEEPELHPPVPGPVDLEDDQRQHLGSVADAVVRRAQCPTAVAR